MSIRNLDGLFCPRSIALIGASDKVGSVGAVVLRNLLQAGFPGSLFPVNPKYARVADRHCYSRVSEIPASVDLGVVCCPARAVPEVISELVAKGARAAVVISAGFHDAALKRELVNASAGSLRLLGPNCVGLLVPSSHLNASFAHLNASAGNIAFVSQSGAFCTAVLDWAQPRQIGFSHFISLGDGLDIDLADTLDYLASDPNTSAILVYVEAITQARKFMSAARAAARNKPVIVLKAGRMQEGAKAAASHTGALAGADAVYDAALERAGVLRVFEVEELFEAAETLQRAAGFAGRQLTILTNGGGPGVTATDTLVSFAGKDALASLSAATEAALAAVLPPNAATANPVDIIGDAPGARFGAAMQVLLKAPEVDCILVLHAPTAMASSREAASAVVEACAGHESGRVIAAWLGEATAAPAREILRAANIPTFETPLSAVRAFWHLLQYRRNQLALMQMPEPAVELAPERDKVASLLAELEQQGRDLLNESEAKRVLAAYGIPVVETHRVASLEKALACAEHMQFPLALKILSPDISHKSDVGGVALDLRNREDLLRAGEAMLERVKTLRPQARLEGFTLQAMARRPGCFETLVGLFRDPLFGPVVLFGEGGTDVELIRDRALALPPLNSTLARSLIERTRISRRFVASRGRSAIDYQALQNSLIRLAQLAVDFPNIEELDINPLLVDADGVLALDARIKVSVARIDTAIRPYPADLEERVQLDNGQPVLLRPIRPEDEAAHKNFFAKLNADDVPFQFFGNLKALEHSQLARYTQIDYDREMAFIALPLDAKHAEPTLGVVRAVFSSDFSCGECAILVRSDFRRLGLGRRLLEKLLNYCRDRGVDNLIARVSDDNQAMLELAGDLGFHRRGEREGSVELVWSASTEIAQLV